LTVQLDDATWRGAWSAWAAASRCSYPAHITFWNGTIHCARSWRSRRERAGSKPDAREDHRPLVGSGDSVEKDAPLLILEAMKMEHTIRAPARGRIARILCRVGEQVGEGSN